MPTLPIPKIVYRPTIFKITVGVNDKIDFEETAATELTATLTAKDIYSKFGMAFEIQRALNAAGASTYTVVFNLTGADINKFTITSDGAGGGGILNLLWSSGTNTATSAKTTLGFDSTDDTGALTYKSDSVVPATVTLTFNSDIRDPRISINPDNDEQISSSGIKQTLHRRLDYMYQFNITFDPRATTANWIKFMEDNALRGGQFDFFPDNAESDFINFTMVKPRRFQPLEMVRQNLFQHFNFTVLFREVLPGETVNTPGGRGSRLTTLLDRAQWL